MSLFSILKKPESINLQSSTIEKRMNAPLPLRLKRYKDIKRETHEFIKWVYENDYKLTVSWHSYSEGIMLIPFGEYCERFYTGTLAGVDPKSIKRFKK